MSKPINRLIHAFRAKGMVAVEEALANGDAVFLKKLKNGVVVRVEGHSGHEDLVAREFGWKGGSFRLHSLDTMELEELAECQVWTMVA